MERYRLPAPKTTSTEAPPLLFAAGAEYFRVNGAGGERCPLTSYAKLHSFSSESRYLDGWQQSLWARNTAASLRSGNTRPT